MGSCFTAVSEVDILATNEAAVLPNAKNYKVWFHNFT